MSIEKETMPYEMDWGIISPDGFNQKEKEALFIFNFDITRELSRDYNSRFILGKLYWSSVQMPSDISLKIIFDLRGQPLTLIEKAKDIKYLIHSFLKKEKPELRFKTEILI
jgi:hypothetical protein